MNCICRIFEQIHIFYIFWIRNLDKIMPKLDLVLLPLKKIFPKIFLGKKKSNQDYNWKKMFVLYSKKKIIFFGNKSIKKKKKLNIYFSKILPIKIIIKKKNFFKIIEKLIFKNKNRLKVGILKKTKKIFFPNSHFFLPKNFLNKVTIFDVSFCLNFFTSFYDQRFLLSLTRIRNYFHSFVRFEIIPTISKFFNKILMFDQKNLFKILMQKSQNKNRQKNLNFNIFMNKKKNYATNKQTFNIGIRLISNTSKSLFFFQMTFLLDPTKKQRYSYQLFVYFFHLFFKKIILEKNLKISFNNFINLTYLLSENISHALNLVKKYVEIKKNLFKLKIDFSQFYILTKKLSGISDINFGFFDICLSKNFFFSIKKTFLKTDNIGSKDFRKIAYFLVKKDELDLNISLQKKKLYEICYMFSLIHRKNFKIRLPRKKFSIDFLFRQIKSGLLSYANRFFTFHNILFFFKKKKVLVFHKIFFFLFSFWKIKKIKFTKKNSNLFLKIDFFILGLNFEKSTQKLFHFIKLDFLLNPNKDFDKMIYKLTLFKFEIQEKNTILKYLFNSRKFHFIKKNIVQIKKVSFKKNNRAHQKSQSYIQFHLNGFCLIQKEKKKNIEIFYKDIKFISLENENSQRSVIIHLYGRKNSNFKNEIDFKELKLYFQNDENKPNSFLPEDFSSNMSEFTKENNDLSINQKIKEVFIFFTNSLRFFSGKNIEIQNKRFGFYSFYKKVIFFVFPTKNYLLNSDLFFFLRISFSDINFIFLEKIISIVKNFDAVIIFNRYNSFAGKKKNKWIRLCSIDFQKINFIENLCKKNLIDTTKGSFALDWNILITKIEKKKIVLSEKQIFNFLKQNKKDEENDGRKNVGIIYIPKNFHNLIKIKKFSIDKLTNMSTSLNWEEIQK